MLGVNVADFGGKTVVKEVCERSNPPFWQRGLGEKGVPLLLW